MACQATFVACANCTEPKTDLRPCTRCYQVAYCGRSCQVNHWRRGGHKLVCVDEESVVVRSPAAVKPPNEDSKAPSLTVLREKTAFGDSHPQTRATGGAGLFATLARSFSLRQSNTAAELEDATMKTPAKIPGSPDARVVVQADEKKDEAASTARQCAICGYSLSGSAPIAEPCFHDENQQQQQQQQQQQHHVFHSACIAGLLRLGVSVACPHCSSSSSSSSDGSSNSSDSATSAPGERHRIATETVDVDTKSDDARVTASPAQLNEEGSRLFYRLNRKVFRHEASWDVLSSEDKAFASKSLDLWRAAAEKGCMYAQANLGNSYELGLCGLPAWPKSDEVMAVHWYRQAARQGHRKSQAALGQLLCFCDLSVLSHLPPSPSTFDNRQCQKQRQHIRGAQKVERSVDFFWVQHGDGRGDVSITGDNDNDEEEKCDFEARNWLQKVLLTVAGATSTASATTISTRNDEGDARGIIDHDNGDEHTDDGNDNDDDEDATAAGALLHLGLLCERQCFQLRLALIRLEPGKPAVCDGAKKAEEGDVSLMTTAALAKETRMERERLFKEALACFRRAVQRSAEGRNDDHQNCRRRRVHQNSHHSIAQFHLGLTLVREWRRSRISRNIKRKMNRDKKLVKGRRIMLSVQDDEMKNVGQERSGEDEEGATEDDEDELWSSEDDNHCDDDYDAGQVDDDVQEDVSGVTAAATVVGADNGKYKHRCEKNKSKPQKQDEKKDEVLMRRHWRRQQKVEDDIMLDEAMQLLRNAATGTSFRGSKSGCSTWNEDSNVDNSDDNNTADTESRMLQSPNNQSLNSSHAISQACCTDAQYHLGRLLLYQSRRYDRVWKCLQRERRIQRTPKRTGNATIGPHIVPESNHYSEDEDDGGDEAEYGSPSPKEKLALRHAKEAAAESSSWFRKSAEQSGSERAQRRLGQSLMVANAKFPSSPLPSPSCSHGDLTRDEWQAAVWYRKAAEQHDAIAQCALARLFLTGTTDNSRSNLISDKSSEDAERSRSRNDTTAAAASAPARRSWLRPDSDRALFWFRRSASQGHTEAQLRLGQLYVALATQRLAKQEMALRLKRSQSQEYNWVWPAGTSSFPSSLPSLSALGTSNKIPADSRNNGKKEEEEEKDEKDEKEKEAEAKAKVQNNMETPDHFSSSSSLLRPISSPSWKLEALENVQLSTGEKWLERVAETGAVKAKGEEGSMSSEKWNAASSIQSSMVGCRRRRLQLELEVEAMCSLAELFVLKAHINLMKLKLKDDKCSKNDDKSYSSKCVSGVDGGSSSGDEAQKVHIEEALRWWRAAAHCGSPRALTVLGHLHHICLPLDPFNISTAAASTTPIYSNVPSSSPSSFSLLRCGASPSLCCAFKATSLPLLSSHFVSSPPSNTSNSDGNNDNCGTAGWGLDFLLESSAENVFSRCFREEDEINDITSSSSGINSGGGMDIPNHFTPRLQQQRESEKRADPHHYLPEQSLERALESYYKAAVLGYAPAQRIIGQSLEDGWEDYKGKQLEKRTCDGSSYDEDVDDDVDHHGNADEKCVRFQQAVMFYRAAAAQGDSLAQCGLCRLLTDSERRKRSLPTWPGQSSVVSASPRPLNNKEAESVLPSASATAAPFVVTEVELKEGGGARKRSEAVHWWLQVASLTGNEVGVAAAFAFKSTRASPVVFDKYGDDGGAEARSGDNELGGQRTSLAAAEEAEEEATKAGAAVEVNGSLGRGAKVGAGTANCQRAGWHIIEAQFRLGVAFMQGWEAMPRYLALGREVGSCRSRSGGSDFSGINTKPWQPFQYQPRKEQVQKRKGHHHGQPDYASAAHWYRKAAQKGHVDAAYNLAHLLLHGAGVDPDDGQAVWWFTKAAEQGGATAQNSLGALYAHGRGVRSGQNDRKAIALYRLAAAQGHGDACFNLGNVYAQGRPSAGVRPDLLKAIEFFERAASQGDREALFQARRLRIDLDLDDDGDDDNNSESD